MNRDVNTLTIGGQITSKLILANVGSNKTLLCKFTIESRLIAKEGKIRHGHYSCQAWKDKAKEIAEIFQQGDKVIIEGAIDENAQNQMVFIHVSNMLRVANDREVIYDGEI